MGLTKGDSVTWNTSQGTTSGTTVERKTKPFQHDKQKFDATSLPVRQRALTSW